MGEYLKTDSYKGVRDFYPEDMAIQEYIFNTWMRVAKSYGFEHYEASVLEPAELYRKKSSEEIVDEQTYTFSDRGEREVTLRPEMTPTAARMVAGRARKLTFPLRWYSIPNLFRYERPQRGRLREHWQLNCDIFGTDNVAADVEIITLAHNIMCAFGATRDDFVIYINDRTILNTYLHTLNLSDEQVREMYRLIDRKDKIETFETDAVALIGRSFDMSALESETSERLKECLSTLRSLGVENVEYKPTIVRGFDYYTGMVFEIFDTRPENNRALFGGGRYDNLTELFGNEQISGVGFGLGDVTMRDFLETHALLPDIETAPTVMILTASDNAVAEALRIREALRDTCPHKSIAVDFSGKKLKDQLKNASKRGVQHTIVIGEDEITSGEYVIRTLSDGSELRGTLTEIAGCIKK